MWTVGTRTDTWYMFGIGAGYILGIGARYLVLMIGTGMYLVLGDVLLLRCGRKLFTVLEFSTLGGPTLLSHPH